MTMLERTYARVSQSLILSLGVASVIYLLWIICTDGTEDLAAPFGSGDSVSETTKQHLRPAWTSIDSIDKIFVFGDSYSDTFFDTKGSEPSDEEPFGNALRPSLIERYNVSTWIKHLQPKLSSNPYVYNFAFGGGRVEADPLEPWPQHMAPSKECISLRGQVRCWAEGYSIPHWKAANAIKTWNAKHTLFSLWSGINDVVQSPINSNHLVAADAVFGSYAALLENLYLEGARNFLLFNVPPLQEARSATFLSPVEPVVDYFNHRLDGVVKKLRLRNRDATYFYFDVHRLFSDVIASPDDFDESARLKEMHTTCAAYGRTTDETLRVSECKYDRDDYFWLAEFYPTPTVHRVIAAVLLDDCFHSDPIRYCSR